MVIIKLTPFTLNKYFNTNLPNKEMTQNHLAHTVHELLLVRALSGVIALCSKARHRTFSQGLFSPS